MAERAFCDPDAGVFNGILHVSRLYVCNPFVGKCFELHARFTMINGVARIYPDDIFLRHDDYVLTDDLVEKAG